jgi:hypothetical protein
MMEVIMNLWWVFVDCLRDFFKIVVGLMTVVEVEIDY